MPRSLWDSAARQDLIDRLGNLRPDSTPLWGRFTATRMLAHVTGWFKMAAREVVCAPRPGILRTRPVRYLAIYVLPFPKGVPTAPELLTGDTTDWQAGVAELRKYLEEFEQRHRGSEFPDHPAFGDLSSDAWGVLGYRHTDHHFRQFGV